MTYRGIAESHGYATTSDHRFNVLLRHQHRIRAHDTAFCAGSARGQVVNPTPTTAQEQDQPGTAAPPGMMSLADRAAIPALRTWINWRRSNLAMIGAKAVNPMFEVDLRRVRGRVAGQDEGVRTVYRCIAAVNNGAEALFQLLYSNIIPDAPVAAGLFILDGKGDVAPGMPGQGKAFGFYYKPLVSTLPQSHRWLLPILLGLGPDTAVAINHLFAEARIANMVNDLHDASYGPKRTVLTSAFAGDYHACTAVVSIASPARHFPKSAGLVAAWQAVLCWFCCHTAETLYAIELAREHQLGSYDADAPSPDNVPATLVGIHASLVFYDIVHLVCVIAQALLCDICVYYVHFSSMIHPVAAYIMRLFASSVWDPPLATAAARSKKRKSRRPLYSVDPAVVWTFLTDADDQAPLIALLSLYPVPIHVPHYPGITTPHRLWTEFLRWFDAVMRGDSATCRLIAPFLEDAWRVMLSVSKPVPADVHIHPAVTKPSFYVPVVAYGPASHTGFCSTPRFIDWVDDACPKWRDTGLSFPKFVATVFLEAGMKVLAEDYHDFAIARHARRFQGIRLLERQSERFGLNAALQFGLDKDDAEGEETRPPVGGETKAANRAYKSIPLSGVVPLHVITDPRVPLA